MKVWLNSPNEKWCVDIFKEEFYLCNKDICVQSPNDAELIWLISDWTWNHFNPNFLKTKKVLTSIHHIVPWKFGEKEKNEFMKRDEITTAYHVPCQITHDFIRPLTQKSIFIRPFWSDPSKFHPLPKSNKDDFFGKREKNKNELREKYGINKNEYVLGSWQRDTEGNSCETNNPIPKTEKGPQNFIVLAEKLKQKYNNLSVLLGGWRRQYIIKKLQELDIKYYYFELPSSDTINEFYNLIDLYCVCSLVEGGPLSIIESSSAGCPIISTPVGIAEAILHPESIIPLSFFSNKDEELLAKPNVEYSFNKINQFLIPKCFKWYIDLFNEIIQNGI